MQWVRCARAGVLLAALTGLLLAGCVTEQRENGKPVDASGKKNNKEAALANYVTLANGYLKDGKREQAMRAINKGLAIDSGSPEMLNVLAFYYSSDGETELAEQQFRKAMGSSEGRSATSLNYGSFLFGQKRYKEACEMFEKAAADPQYAGRASAFSNLGTCLRQQGDMKGAEEALSRSLAHDSRNPRALLEMSLIKFDQGNFADSRRYYEGYLQYARQTPKSLWLGIRLMRVFGDDDKLASYALYLKNQFPTSQEYLEYKAWSESR